jgi:hypothetical protein
METKTYRTEANEKFVVDLYHAVHDTCRAHKPGSTVCIGAMLNTISMLITSYSKDRTTLVKNLSATSDMFKRMSAVTIEEFDERKTH